MHICLEVEAAPVADSIPAVGKWAACLLPCHAAMVLPGCWVQPEGAHSDSVKMSCDET